MLTESKGISTGFSLSVGTLIGSMIEGAGQINALKEEKTTNKAKVKDRV